MTQPLNDTKTPPPLFPFDNSYARLPERFFAPVEPTRVEAPLLIKLNEALADELGLDPAALKRDGAAIFSGNSVPEGAAPLAMAYAGHQFGGFSPQLGDGRAILLGEVIDKQARRRDLQLKGSGPTPFSRRGDGRAALGPVLREYIVSEFMHAVGIPTTRALAAVITGEPVYREDVLPGAVFTRVAASHIRIGTFQYFAARDDQDAVKTLADYVIDRHYPMLRNADDPYLSLYKAICERQADLIARWLSIGFIHGVMNTDNMTVSGETIDFGPCAFLDAYDPAKTFSSIDRQGRYAYANQPAIGQWNLARLGETLLPLFDPDKNKAVDMANAVIGDYGHRFQHHWLTGMTAKIGLQQPQNGDLDLVQSLLSLMHTQRADFTLTFRRLGECMSHDDMTAFTSCFADSAACEPWLERWSARLLSDPQTAAERIDAMRQINPAFIPRNHRIEQAIEAAMREGDFAPFETLLRVLSKPFDEQPTLSAYATPPKPEEEVRQTFCGT